MELDLFEEFTRRDWETTTPDTLRVGVVGLGSYTRRRALPAIEEADYCEAGAVVSGDRAKAERFGEEYGATPLTYEEFADGAGREAYDAVYIVTPNALHLPHAETAAGMGKHVLCEKPLEATAERAAATVEACENAGVTLMTAYRLQADPAVRRAREAVQAGALGEVVHVHGDFSFRLLDGGPADQWRLDPDLAGGGALYDIGVYPLNTTRFLLDSDPVAVSARVSAPDDAFEVDEYAAYQVEFPVATGAYTTSYNLAEGQSLELVGTEGRLAIDPPFHAEQNRTLAVERGGERATFRGEYVNEVAEQLDYFAHAAHTGERPDPDGRDGQIDVAALEAIIEAGETGERVALR